MALDNTTGTEDNVIDRAEGVEDEVPVVKELLDITRRLDEELTKWKDACSSAGDEPAIVEEWIDERS